MPLVVYKSYSLPANFTDEEKAMWKDLIDQFRLRAGDDIPEENILYKKMSRYTDNRIISFFNTAANDINGYVEPATPYTVSTLYSSNEQSVLVMGAIVMMLQREGIFQAANQIDFNDSGLSIGMYNKTGIYQGWWGPLAQEYNSYKEYMKRSKITKSNNAGFYGISSEFGWKFGQRTYL